MTQENVFRRHLMNPSIAKQAQRLNTALSLTKKYSSVSETVNKMAEQFSISKRQAYRYIREASEIGERVPIPDQKVAFTVKLSQSLVQRLREYSKSSEKSLSVIVTQSLEVFLQNGLGQRQKK